MKESKSLYASCDRNVLPLLARREICPRKQHRHKLQWRKSCERNCISKSIKQVDHVLDPKHGLLSWAEKESLRHLSAKYCSLLPPPRSTIAAAFSPDGKKLASTHGDHTVKIIDCQTGKCLKVLNGHRRTPWVVRFHPLNPEIIASGSLDYQVRLWNANTTACIGSHDFCRPIASIAFHAEGELLAVASGHKLYIWQYNRDDEASTPAVVLKTRRSLRAVHFHPQTVPFLLTAEVNDLDSSDPSMTIATSPGSLRYPPPAVFVSNANADSHVRLAAELPLVSSFPITSTTSNSDDDSMGNVNFHVNSHFMQMESPRPDFPSVFSTSENCYASAPQEETMPGISSSSYNNTDNVLRNSYPFRTEIPSSSNNVFPAHADGVVENHYAYFFAQMRSSHGEFLPSPGFSWWEIPFFHGWLVGQGQAMLPSMVPLGGVNHGPHGNSARPLSSLSMIPTHNMELSSPITGRNLSEFIGVSSSAHSDNIPYFSLPESVESLPSTFMQVGTSETQHAISRIHSEVANSLASAAAAELPCTVKLRIWSYDRSQPCAPLAIERCRFIIPHAVLCSEMGAHFSPCGRYLAACVACAMPQMEVDPILQSYVHQDLRAPSSPTRHPISAQQVIYELRIYSLEEAMFGSVVISRAIRAAHCLTSIQFSPTSEHILLAYGRRHGSLLKSIVIDGESTSPIYTVLEVYRVSDMELVMVLPSAVDEVNVACFHPNPGGGLVYGTKEGKLRILQYDRGSSSASPNHFHDHGLSEVYTHALEG